MNANMKRTMLALAVATMFGTSMAYAADNEDKSANIDHQHIVNDQRTHDNTVVNDTTNSLTTNNAVNNNYTANSSITVSDQENTNKETNNHSVDVAFWKHLGLTTDVTFSGNPTITGNINLDSAAIAIIDNRQSVSNNNSGGCYYCYDSSYYGSSGNYMLNNSSSIGDQVGSSASGNIGMNVAAGDNNAQDNAAALSATDASFAFGSTDAEVFVNQAGNHNMTTNWGVTNDASVSGNAFSAASGNIGVNVTSGNNNEQKNALAAAVATAAFAQSSVSSNQISNDNAVSNAGYAQQVDRTIDVTLNGYITGSGSYSGSSQGAAYQMANFYPDTWTGSSHPGGKATGHIDYDSAAQGAVPNPNRNGVGGFAFDTQSTDSGSVAFGIDDLGLAASLSGQVVTTDWIRMDATNTASLSGNAFASASGNIGVNVASGTGNLQANSLALSVAQPGSAGPVPPGE
ncbi:MAG: adhesin [Rhodanobacter sp.]